MHTSLYQSLQAQARQDPDSFWRAQAQRLDWITPFETVFEGSFLPPVSISWYKEGTLNACYNAVDRHLKTQKNSPALTWVGDTPGQKITFTYEDLYHRVNEMAASLKALGVEKGHRVILYLPMIPEAVFAMLACARLGAVHSVVFGGFSADALAGRIQDSGATIVITATQGRRGGKTIELKASVDQALKQCAQVERVLVIPSPAAPQSLGPKDIVYDQKSFAGQIIQPEPMGAEDPLFILYTSGSTGTPKGVVHTTGGYLVYAALTHEVVFDLKPKDVYWCTADVGWITGHTYVVYGPLVNGAHTIIFEGIPTYPHPGRFWDIIDDLGVTLFYTAPTVLRSLMQMGDAVLQETHRRSLRVLGSVGEPINAEAWHWYHDKVGGGRCPISDTWWQTETGGILISPIPGVHQGKPGYATEALFGITPALLDENGVELQETEATGNLCIKTSWPGQMRGIYGDAHRFEETYFSQFPGYYSTGDGAIRDQDHHYRITGRVDDVLNVSGHRFGTAELETAATTDPRIIEAAVVGVPHAIKGEGIFVFAVAALGCDETPAELEALVSKTIVGAIGAIARPQGVLLVPGLPKTRSGKIMRRLLRNILRGEHIAPDTITTLADPSVLAEIQKLHEKTPR